MLLENLNVCTFPREDASRRLQNSIPLETRGVAQGHLNKRFLINALLKTPESWRFTAKKKHPRGCYFTHLINKRRPERSITIPLVMLKVCIVTDFILIKAQASYASWELLACFKYRFLPGCMNKPPRMILRRSGSCDGREHTLLSKPLKRCMEAAVVNVHLVRYTYGSLKLA